MHRSLLSVSWDALKLLRTSMKSGWMWTRLASGQCDVPMVVPKEEVIRFVSECMCKAGTSLEDGCIVGHHLMTADYRGHFSHGINRMQMYVQDIKDGMTNPTAKPEILTDFQVRRNLLSSDETMPRLIYLGFTLNVATLCSVILNTAASATVRNLRTRVTSETSQKNVFQLRLSSESLNVRCKDVKYSNVKRDNRTASKLLHLDSFTS